MNIDKNKAVRKWAPVIESMGITDLRKTELMSVFAEYRSAVCVGGSIVGNLNNAQQPPIWKSHITVENLPAEMRILSEINLNNKIVIFSGLNDGKLKFIRPAPMTKFSLSVVETSSDIKVVRKNKITAINSGNTNVDSDLELMYKRITGLIISDINAKLKDGQILYIDQELITSVTEKFNNGNTEAFECVVRYDVI